MRQQLDFDPFNYSDGALATESDGKWTNCAGFGTIQVVNLYDRAITKGDGTDCAAVITAWGGSPTDQYAEQLFVALEGGLTLRSDEANNFILVDFVADDPSADPAGVYVFEVIAGTLNLLEPMLALDHPLIAYQDRIYAEIQGSTILVKQNETVLGTRIATGAIGSGKPGFFLVEYGSRGDWMAGDFQAQNPLLAVGLV